MKILIATHNQSKLKRYIKILKAIDFIEPVSLTDLGITEKVEENHTTNIGNALLKAKIYGKLSGLITVAVDEALMTNFLPDSEQPGVYARRFAGDKKEMSDTAIVDVWEKILKLYPQPDKQFIWDFAVAYYNPDTDSEGVESIEEISHVAKYFSDIKPSGYPMSSFLSPYVDGKPYSEISDKENDQNDAKSFANFVNNFQKWLHEQTKQ